MLDDSTTFEQVRIAEHQKNHNIGQTIYQVIFTPKKSKLNIWYEWRLYLKRVFVFIKHGCKISYYILQTWKIHDRSLMIGAYINCTTSPSFICCPQSFRTERFPLTFRQLSSTIGHFQSQACQFVSLHEWNLHDHEISNHSQTTKINECRHWCEEPLQPPLWSSSTITMCWIFVSECNWHPHL